MCPLSLQNKEVFTDPINKKNKLSSKKKSTSLFTQLNPHWSFSIQSLDS